MRRALVLVALAAGLAPASASASSACSRAWDGGAGTLRFSDAANWAGDQLPLASEHVCIAVAASDPVIEVDGAATVRVIDSTEPLKLTGSLTVTDPSEPSSLTRLEVAGTLAGAASVSVAGGIAFTGGQLDGSVTVTTGVAAVNVLRSGSMLGSAVLDLGGSTTIEGGGIAGSGQARIVNRGAVTVLDGGYLYPAGQDAEPVLRNVGTITKTGVATATLSFGLDNDGTVTATGGQLDLGNGEWDPAGRSTGRYGSSGSGVVAFVGGTHRLGDGAGFDGATIANGRVEILGDGAGPGRVTVAGGTLAGDGVLSQAGGLSLTGGQIGGSVAILAGGPNLLRSGALLDTAILDLSGTTTIESGGIAGHEQARIVNRGAMTILDRGYLYPAGQDAAPVLRNAGTITKTGSETAWLNFGLDNDGTVAAAAGTLYADRVAFTARGRQRVLVGTGSTAPGVLAIGQTAKLNGTVVLETAPGYTPTLGDEIVIATYPARSGEPAQVQSTPLGGGLAYRLDVGDQQLTVRVVAAAPQQPPAAAPRSATVAPVSPVELAPLVARADVLRIARGATLRLRSGLLANDDVGAARPALVVTRRGAGFRVLRVDARGRLVVRLRARVRRATFSYRLVAGGQRSAPVRVRVLRRAG